MNNILIIDDEKNIRMTVKNCLENAENTIDVAVNGEEGFSLMQQKQYDLVLLDINMPGITGIDLLKKVRDQQMDTNIVIMTAYGTVDKAVEAMKLGAIDFLSKPFTPTEIRELVENVMRRKQLKEDQLETFSDVLEYAKSRILEHDYTKAEAFLKKAIALDVDSPEPHNLLGVISEMRHNKRVAQQHYRAALALDPTHKAADKNLERTVLYDDSAGDFDLGDPLD